MVYSHTIHKEREFASSFYLGIPAHRLAFSFVFDNYTWNRDGGVYSNFNGNLIPSTIPMTVQIAGAAFNTLPSLQIHISLQDPWLVALSRPVTIRRDLL